VTVTEYDLECAMECAKPYVTECEKPYGLGLAYD
jgi:hypothetical protein